MIVNSYLISAVQNKNDHLAHHGIDGQKWGSRNGPPYPLQAGQYSSEEKKLNKGRFNVGNAVRKVKKVVRTTTDTARKIDRKYKEYKRNKDIKNINKKKHKILMSGNREDIYRNRALFSNDEIDRITERLKKEDALKSLTMPSAMPVKQMEQTKSKEINEGYEKTKKMMSEAKFWLDATSSVIKDGYAIADNSKKLYNVYANYKNTENPFGGMQDVSGRYRIIPSGDKDKN